ncbi:hypothetical protein DICPUDRAFT_155607 [Dictyostelium purpureum]|uniref:Uncharacterized protein n=1 Tax=Dictyostelium purpureum TaxID=5786 RepID=F0ZUG1_DICPU|nr:uncharacterized protein DICPUDRAFT_155607 [Dictyostelium purpureum]EGC32407.1 hypothetical protein DICPUDRAFT_155607 [Dictyostelium purpureum]|eukprot:XP_003291054.1 hypothetical protein DICPUDRAFT_155607 [Dictyostelium purpureum]
MEKIEELNKAWLLPNDQWIVDATKELLKSNYKNDQLQTKMISIIDFLFNYYCGHNKNYKVFDIEPLKREFILLTQSKNNY